MILRITALLLMGHDTGHGIPKLPFYSFGKLIYGYLVQLLGWESAFAKRLSVQNHKKKKNHISVYDFFLFS
jgi:hypothetical protein